MAQRFKLFCSSLNMSKSSISRNFTHRKCGNSKTFIFLCAFLSISGGCAHSSQTPYFSLKSGALLSLDYAGTNLLEEIPAYSAIQIQTEIPAPSAAEYNKLGPDFRIEEGRLCVRNIGNYYYSYEAGLRFEYCEPESIASDISIPGILEILAWTGGSNQDSALPYFDTGTIRLEISSLSQLRKTGGILVSVDAGQTFNGIFSDNLLRGKVLHLDSRLPLNEKNIGAGVLPRRFSQASYNLLATENEVILVYSTEDADRLLLVRIRSIEASSRITAGLQRIFEIQTRLLQQAGHDGIFLSEIFFRDSAGGNEEFLEISGRAGQNTLGRIQLQTDTGFVFDSEVFLFASSAAVFSPSSFPGFSFKRSVSAVFAAGSAIYNLESYSQSGGSPKRSIDAADAGGIFSAVFVCYSNPICANRGLSPDILDRLNQSASEDPSRCRMDDYTLTEINPFGIHENLPDGSASATIDAGGKFVEISANRPCVHGSVVFYAGDAILDSGAGAQQTLLFAAQGSFFTEPPLVAPELRGFSEYDEVSGFDLISNSRRSLRRGVPLNVHYIRGDSSGRSPVFRRVYSLISDDFLRRDYFHAASSAGLRSDLSSNHSMSPGIATPLEKNSLICGRLSEIFPLSSRDASGVLTASDEFFEISGLCPVSGNSGLTLRVQRLSDGKIDEYKFPRPEAQYLNAGRLAIFRSDPHCWNRPSGAVYFSGLSLPDEGADYSLLDEDGNILDTAAVERADIESLSAPRSSFYYHPGAGRWRATDFSDAENLCGPYSLGTPGGNEAYRPFLHPLTFRDDRRVLRLFSTNNSETVFWKAGARLDVPEIEYSFQLSTGADFDFSYPSGASGRKLMAANDASGNLIFLGEIYPAGQRLSIDAVSATPAAGSVEWLRLCAPLPQYPAGSPGFQPRIGEFLHIKDSASADRIIPYAGRFSGTFFSLRADSLSLSPGECALLVDPDYSGQPLPLAAGDVSLWTIESTSTIGNGLSSGEGLMIYSSMPDGSSENLCSLGLPDTMQPFHINTSSSEYVRRKPGFHFDLRENYEVVR